MNFKKLGFKIFLIIGFFIVISIIVHINKTGNDEVFEDLYQGLKKVEAKEKSFMKFTQYNKKAGDYLIKKLPEEKDNLIKTDVIQIIGFSGCTNCEERLISLLNDSDWHVRFFVIDTLDKLNYKDMPILLPKVIINDTNENVRIEAIITLGKYGNEKDISFLEGLVSQKDYKTKKLSKAIDIALTKLKSKFSKN